MATFFVTQPLLSPPFVAPTDVASESGGFFLPRLSYPVDVLGLRRSWAFMRNTVAAAADTDDDKTFPTGALPCRPAQENSGAPPRECTGTKGIRACGGMVAGISCRVPSPLRSCFFLSGRPLILLLCGVGGTTVSTPLQHCPATAAEERGERVVGDCGWGVVVGIGGGVKRCRSCLVAIELSAMGGWGRE